MDYHQRRVFSVEPDPLCCMQTGLSFKSSCDECTKGAFISYCFNTLPDLCIYVASVSHAIDIVSIHSCLILTPIFSCDSCMHPHVAHTRGDSRNDTQTTFLAWQTWDLLRLTIGFTGLCKDFLARNPGYFLKPIRVKGSVVESLLGDSNITLEGICQL